MKLELKKESWEQLFETIRNNELKTTGNFWTVIQRLEEQYSEQTDETKRYCATCGAECKIHLRKDGCIKKVTCEKHPGNHADGSYDYCCFSDYCRCMQ